MTGQDAACRAAKTYLSRDIETGDPISRVVRVFELASSHLIRARAAMRSGNVQLKGREIQKVSSCLQVLQTSLDMERGGEYSRNMDRLYGYYQLRLTHAHLHNDDALLGDIGQGLAELAGAWREVLRQGAPRRAPEGLVAR